MRYDFYGLKEIEYCTGEEKCGFVREAGTFPKRALDTARLRLTEKGVQITETADTMWREGTAGQGDACWIWSYDFVCGKQPLEVEVEVSASKAREILEAAGGTARTGGEAWATRKVRRL